MNFLKANIIMNLLKGGILHGGTLELNRRCFSSRMGIIPLQIAKARESMHCK